MRYETEATIHAEPQAVWAIVSDATAWPSWNSGVERVEGVIEPGQKITVYSELNPGRAFPVRVSELDPPRRMTWTGGMPLGLFRGVRTYELEPTGEGATRFTMREVFSGPLLPLIRRSMPDLGPSFEQFARGLKERAEAGGSY